MNTTEFRIGFLGMLAAFAICGCAGTGPLNAVSVVALDDTATLQTDQTMTGFQTSVQLRNGGARAVYVAGCGPDAEKQVGSKWVRVWTPVCGGALWRALGPRDSITVPVRISAFINGNGYPQLDPGFSPGIFRLIFRVADVPLPGPKDKVRFRASSSFVVKSAAP